MNFKKYSLITGAAGFLGKMHAEALLEQGNNIIITDLKKNYLSRLQKKLADIFNESEIIAEELNVTSENSIKELIKKLKRKNILVNVLINNAIIDHKFKYKKNFNNLSRLENYSLKAWKKEIDVGLTGPMLCSKYFGHEMAKNNISGVIINIGSDLSVIAPNQNIYSINSKNIRPVKPVTYSVIKHGMLGLTKYFASLYAKNNVRVNMVSPGSIKNNQSKNLLKELNNIIPMGRLGSYSEILGILFFLANNDSSYITGQNILIDGGRTII